MPKNLSEKTIKNYECALQRLKKLNIDIDNFIINSINETLEKEKVTEFSQTTYFSALLWYYTNNKSDQTDIIKKLKEEIYKKNYKNQLTYLHSEMSEREKNNYVDWETIVNLHKKFVDKLDNETNMKIIEDSLILSYYVYNLPRRLDYYSIELGDYNIPEDKRKILWLNSKSIEKYGREYIDSNKKDEMAHFLSIGKKKNLYVNHDDHSYFIFQDYKTNNIYGNQIIEVNNELDKIIKKIIKLKNLKIGDKLLDINYKSFESRLRRIFLNTLKKKISASMLRHIYITYAYNNLFKNDYDKFILSRFMAHSVATQSIYRKIIPDEITKNVNEITDNYKKNNKYEKYQTNEERKIGYADSKKKWYEKNKEKLMENQKKKRLLNKENQQLH